jgi:hypothetical protein
MCSTQKKYTFFAKYAWSETKFSIVKFLSPNYDDGVKHG